jgi:hypothetical protein
VLMTVPVVPEPSSLVPMFDRLIVVAAMCYSARSKSPRI